VDATIRKDGESVACANQVEQHRGVDVRRIARFQICLRHHTIQSDTQNGRMARQDQGVLGHFGQTAGPIERKLRTDGADEIHILRQQRRTFHLRGGLGGGNQGDINLSGEQVVLHHRTCVLQRFDEDRGVSLQEAFDRRSCQQGACGGWDGDMQAARRHARECDDLFTEVRHLAQHSPGAFMQQAASLGEPHTTAVPFEHGNAEIIFQ
jgi:hypothetical protein